jgi:hypothetical protein
MEGPFDFEGDLQLPLIKARTKTLPFGRNASFHAFLSILSRCKIAAVTGRWPRAYRL